MPAETLLEFDVIGTPAPQGSKQARTTKAGATYMHEGNRERLEPWRNAIAAAAQAAMLDAGDEGPFAGPLRLVVTFVFARPQSHYRTGAHAGELKSSAPIFCDKRPDLDKLVRALGDAITGIVVVDDAAFVELAAAKTYGSPAAHVTIRGLA
jgi:crossover junction endodeoxyribonuclease RusA